MLALTVRAGEEKPPGRAETDASPAIFRRLGSSPVEAFRKLLAMSEAERDRFLTNYPAATRERILFKLEQYQMLPVEYRELRLRVTELRWYLLPLLKAAPDQRSRLLESVPESCRESIKARLEEWDLWPPSLKDEVLEYESTFSSFVGRDAAGNAVVAEQIAAADLSEKDRLEAERKLAQWQAMGPGERQQVFGGFVHYFDLSEPEKQKTLDALSEPERQETEKVLNPIEKWPKAQQKAYLAAFRQFADMSPEQRQKFMNNAGRWQKMSPAERQAWRDLLQRLPASPPHPQPTGPAVAPGHNTNSTGAVPSK
jgi:predicted Fe-S protein YdhL (DUF1289 family)